ncbi:MAG: hypothetical protein NC209_08390 [Alistipes sp.]|nr:hypothetical protein [Alistipes senegalensis]MCM1251141.1 hypothetical protein [Alistipes sp.]
MRKLFLLCSVVVLAGSCIDRDYDLSDLDTDRIAIGDETSRFTVPLARISVALDEIHDDKGSLRQMLAEADVWLPSQLPGGAAYVDLVAVRADDAYLAALLDALIAQMHASERKLGEVADLIWSDYREDFRETLGLPATVGEAQFKEVFAAQFRSGSLGGAIRLKTEESARRYLTALDVESLEYRLGSLDLGDAVDMLADNLDPAGTPDPVNTLSIEGEVSSTLPLVMSLAPAFHPTRIEIATFRIEAGATTRLPSTRIYAEDLRSLCDASDVVVRIPVSLQQYYPGMQIDERTPVSIRLSLCKTGSLKLDL